MHVRHRGAFAQHASRVACSWGGMHRTSWQQIVVGEMVGTTVEVSKQELADFPGNPWLKHGVPWATERVQKLEDERILTIRNYACKDLV